LKKIIEITRGTSKNCVGKQNSNYLLRKTKLTAICALLHKCSTYYWTPLLTPLGIFNTHDNAYLLFSLSNERPRHNSFYPFIDFYGPVYRDKESDELTKTKGKRHLLLKIQQFSYKKTMKFGFGML